MALIPRRLGKDEREALLLLADAADGCTQSILMAHGFAIGVLHDLVRDGLATATRESAIAARRGIVVTRLRITDAGRWALTQ
jgi:hydrogenase maturation factor